MTHKSLLTVRNLFSFFIVCGFFGFVTIPNYFAYYTGASVWVMALGIGLLFGSLLYLLVFGGVKLIVIAFGSGLRSPKVLDQTAILESGLQEKGDISDRQVFIVTRILLPIVGLLLGGLFAYGFLNLPLGNWQKMESAPQPVAALIDNVVVDFFDDVLFVKAQNSQIYAYNCPLMKDTCTWLKIDHPPEPVSVGHFDCGETAEFKKPTPLLFGTVYQHVIFGYCGGESVRLDHFILLQDGSIWHWKHWTSAYDLLLFTPLVIVAGLIAGGAGMLVLLVDRKLIQ